MIYLLPFIAVMVDETVLHTHWFYNHLPAWVGEVLRAMYPFYKLFTT